MLEENPKWKVLRGFWVDNLNLEAEKENISREEIQISVENDSELKVNDVQGDKEEINRWNLRNKFTKTSSDSIIGGTLYNFSMDKAYNLAMVKSSMGDELISYNDDKEDELLLPGLKNMSLGKKLAVRKNTGQLVML